MTPEPSPRTGGGLPGSGLVKGLAVTLKTLLQPSVTQQYPDVPPALPPRSRGVIALLEENCTVCMLCARECPDWCIYIDSHKEVVPATEPGARERTRNVLDRFAIDYALCMWCSICVEACPFDALFWSPEFEFSEYDVRDLTHERDRLRDWMWTVPPPAPLETGAEEAKEVEAARKALDRPARTTPPDRPARTAPAERPARTTPPDRPARTAPAERPARTGPPEPPRPAGPAEQAASTAPAEAAPPAVPARRPRRRLGEVRADDVDEPSSDARTDADSGDAGADHTAADPDGGPS